MTVEGLVEMQQRYARHPESLEKYTTRANKVIAVIKSTKQSGRTTALTHMVLKKYTSVQLKDSDIALFMDGIGL